MLFDYDSRDPDFGGDSDLSSTDPIELCSKEELLAELDEIGETRMSEDEFQEFVERLLAPERIYESGLRPEGEKE